MIETLFNVFVIPTARSLFGWAYNAFEDKEISKFELESLVKTLIRVNMLAAGVYFGTDYFGMNIDAFSASAGSAFVDWVLYYLRNIFKPKN